MSDVFSRIWHVMETDPGHRALTTDLPRADLKELGFSLLNAGEVFVISGFPVQRAGGKGETDGPIGTANLAAVLEKAGLTMDNVIKTTVFLSDMNNFGAMNEVYATFFSEGNYPARSAVEVARLPKDALVEIEVIAVK